MEFIRAYIDKHNYAPSQEEIASELGISSRQTKRCLRSLILDERLETDARLETDRAIRIPGYKLIKIISGDAEKYVVESLKMVSNITDYHTAKCVYTFIKRLTEGGRK